MALVACLSLAGSSCSKILDLQPHTSTFTEAYFKTQQDARTAIAGAYALLRNNLVSNNSWHIYGDVTAGEFDINSGLDAFTYPIELGQYIGLNVQSFNWNWSGYYQLMQQINLIIKKVPDIPVAAFEDPAEKARIVSEAYFLRAFTYFYMSRIWGDVPLKLEPDLDISQAKNIPRSSAAAVLAQCLADCNQAEQGLVFGYTNSDEMAVRANKGTVLALKAHLQAWTHDYAACEKTADSVILYGQYRLLDSADYKQVFIGKTAEGIFEINMNYSQNEAYSPRMGYTLPTISVPFLPTQPNLNWPISQQYIKILYPDHDPAHPDPEMYDTLNDVRYRDFYYHAATGSGQTVKYSNFIFPDGAAKQDPRLSNNMNIFRLPDMYLLRAEALDSLGSRAEAINMLNVVKARAGLLPYVDTANAPELKHTIVKERLREFFYEGQSFYDLVRTHTVADFNQNFSDAQVQAGGWMWPVDPVLFKDDFTLTQTPYWLGRL